MILRLSTDLEHNKHNNADSLTRKNCTQCKRHQCGGASVTEREVRILCQHEDRLDTNEEQDVQEDGVFLALPVTVGEQETLDVDGTNWFFTWSHDELVRMQEEEPAISDAIQWKTTRGEKPPWDEISHEGVDLKALSSQWTNLEVRDGLLCRRFLSEETKNLPDEETVIFQVVAPRKILREILKQVHNHKTAGHLGVTKTLYNVRRHFYWPGHRADIRHCCHHCKECNMRNHVISSTSQSGQRVML